MAHVGYFGALRPSPRCKRRCIANIFDTAVARETKNSFISLFSYGIVVVMVLFILKLYTAYKGNEIFLVSAVTLIQVLKVLRYPEVKTMKMGDGDVLFLIS